MPTSLRERTFRLPHSISCKEFPNFWEVQERGGEDKEEIWIFFPWEPYSLPLSHILWSYISDGVITPNSKICLPHTTISSYIPQARRVWGLSLRLPSLWRHSRWTVAFSRCPRLCSSCKSTLPLSAYLTILSELINVSWPNDLWFGKSNRLTCMFLPLLRGSQQYPQNTF